MAGHSKPNETVNAERVVARMADANNTGINIVVLDASRWNPYPDSKGKGFYRHGLSPMRGFRNTLISFASDEGEVAFDGNGRNSLYTQHLIRALRRGTHRRIEIEDVFRQVASSVSEESGGQQSPWYQSTLIEDYCFGSCSRPVASEPKEMKRERLTELYQMQSRSGVSMEVEQEHPAQPATEREAAIEVPPTAKYECGFWANLFGQCEKSPKKDVTTIERYPTVEHRDRVPVGQTFSVKVSLTEDLITPQVAATASKHTGKHSQAKMIKKDDKGEAIWMSLSNQLKVPTPTNGQDAWEIEVELSAPAFNFQGSDFLTITLPLQGDSEIARFRLTPKPIQGLEKKQKIYALLWHQGVYLARIMREITVTNQSWKGLQLVPGSISPKKEPKQVLPLNLRSPDLTLYLEHKQSPDSSRISLHSRRLQRVTGSFERTADLSKWLNNNYKQFALASQNIFRKTIITKKPPKSEIDKNIALMIGFGRQLYDKFAPQEFKTVFWKLKDELGDKFNTIHIFTDDPLVPWELMIPSRDKEELRFLGIDFQVARWHLNDTQQQLARPAQSFGLQKLFAIVPKYPDDNWGLISNELSVLKKMTHFYRVLRRYEEVSNLFRNAHTNNSIIHFAGHGIVQESQPGLVRYAIKLEDGELNVMTWRGLMPRSHQTHPLFFFNACDVGQAHHVANFVDGWAPAVLEAGATGYIGGLWPLASRGATEFAEKFYQQLEANLQTEKSANVAELLQKTRQHFYQNGDPTFLGYVYYGDPHFQLSKSILKQKK